MPSSITPITLKAQPVQQVSPPKAISSLGTVLFEDNFEGTLRWYGDSDAPTLASTARYVTEGSKALLQKTKATSAWNNTAQCSFPFIPEAIDRKIRVAFNWCPTKVAAAEQSSMSMTCDIRDNVNSHAAGIKYDFVNTKFQYRNSSGSYVDFSPVFEPTLTENMWLRLEFMYDLKIDEYVYFRFNNTETDMRGTAAQAAAAANNYSLVQFTFTGIDATQRDNYIDQFSITYE